MNDCIEQITSLVTDKLSGRMTGDAPKSERSPAPDSAFFWIAVGMLVMLLLCGFVGGALLASQARQINRDGGWGWLLFGGVFVAVATLVSAGCAVCTALSLWRREAHRTMSIVLLIGSCLFLWAFGSGAIHMIRTVLGQDANAAARSIQSRRPSRGAVSRVTISDSLLRHFREQGIILSPAGGANRGTEWIFANADVGARCEVVTRFVSFPKGTTVEDKKAFLQTTSTPSSINEHTDLAMFHPHARGTTSDVTDCEAWAGKSGEIVEKLLDAFTSYQPPPPIPVRVNPVQGQAP